MFYGKMDISFHICYYGNLNIRYEAAGAVLCYFADHRFLVNVVA